MRASTVLALFIAVFAVVLYVGHTAVTKNFDDFGEKVIDHEDSDSRKEGYVVVPNSHTWLGGRRCR